MRLAGRGEEGVYKGSQGVADEVRVGSGEKAGTGLMMMRVSRYIGVADAGGEGAGHSCWSWSLIGALRQPAPIR